MQRGVLYVTWGDAIRPILDRSIQSLKSIHPELPVEVVRDVSGEGLRAKTDMGSLSPFESTLYLDADTIVIGRLDFAFEKAERFGLACCICEAPWMRRYGLKHECEWIEYNTGVLFFNKFSQPVFDHWRELSGCTPAQSRWRMYDDPSGAIRGLEYDDQASFGRAVQLSGFNPFILPVNYNLRPSFHRSFFSPAKIWHDYNPPPQSVIEVSRQVEAGVSPITYMELDRL